MSLEKSIIKRPNAETSTFDYKPRELSAGTSTVARSFVNEDAFISTDFQISELIAKQAGISQLEDDAHQDKINAQVLERVGSSRVDLQACKLEYSIVSPK